MDDMTRQIVKFVSAFDESRMTPAVVHAVNRTMIDTMAAIIFGFEEEPTRIAALVASQVQARPGAPQSTVFGSRRVQSWPRLRTASRFASPISMTTPDIPAILFPRRSPSANRCTRPAEVMTAIAVGYEVSLVPIGFGPVESR